ncbi:MAG: CidA/LrgA family protein [Bauldia sp.]|nr:CidA/LrgA family protein [Bauldia sp.]
MIESLTFLLLAQLAGEIIVRSIGLPVPGPVIGLMLLALVMAWRGIPAALHETALGLLRNLSLLFVPAGVGVIRQADALADNWLALSVALVVSTMATLAVTALTFRWAQKRFGHTAESEAAE